MSSLLRQIVAFVNHKDLSSKLEFLRSSYVLKNLVLSDSRIYFLIIK